MNQTLRYFKSYDDIDSRNSLIDFTNVYVLTFISLFGITTNTMCIYVLNHLNRSEFMVKFMLAYSLFDLGFHSISIIVGLLRCGSLCAYGFTQIAKYIELYFYIYGQNVVLLSCFLLELLISINRIVSFTNRKSPYSIINNNNFLPVLMSILLFSLVVISVSYFSLREVKQFGWIVREGKLIERLFFVGTNTDVTNKIIIAINVNRGAVLLFILFLLNLIILYKYHVYKRRRESNRITVRKGIKFEILLHRYRYKNKMRECRGLDFFLLSFFVKFP